VEVNIIKIKPTVTFRYKGKTYPSGAIVEIDPKHFNASFMVKVEEPKPVETIIKEVVMVEPITTDEAPKVEDSNPVEEKSKPRRVPKKHAY